MNQILIWKDSGAADWQSVTFPLLKYTNKMCEPQHLS